MNMSERELEENETVRLISSEKVSGTSVYGPDREHIGEIEKVMIDKRTGQVAFAVMSFGGFLGIGERHHPLPWQQLHYDETLDGYLVSVTRDQLEEMPHYRADEEPNWEDRDWNRDLRLYYHGLPATPFI